MAKNQEATLILKIKETVSAALDKVTLKFQNMTKSVEGGGMAKASSAMGNLASAAFRAAGPLIAVGTAIAGAGLALGKLALNSDVANAVAKSFENLAAKAGFSADIMLTKMKQATNGTISDLELMKQANTAALLGLPLERMGEMMNIAKTSAKTTGQSMEFMLQSIVTGLGRGSKLILDNLGIMVNADKANENYAASLGKTAASLTETEKKQAFINEALRVGTENSNKAGLGTVTLTDQWDRFKATLENWAVIVGSKLAPAFSAVLGFVNTMAEKIEKAFSTPSIDDNYEKVKQLTAQYELLTKEMKSGSGYVGARAKEARAATLKEIAAINEVIAAQERKQTIEQQELARQKEKNSALQAEEAAHQEKIAAQQKAAEDAKKQRDQENKEIEKTEKAIRDEEEMLALQERLGIHNEMEKQAAIEANNEAILNATDRSQKLALIHNGNLLKSIDTNAKLKADGTKFKEWEHQTSQEKLENTKSTLDQISSLQNAKNKELVMLGKAAAIASIAISTQQGAMKAYATLGIFGGPAAALIIAAGAVSAAKVAGVELAEGGIVQARPGGIQATIGEGGRDEAVIPLDDPRTAERLGGMGGNTYIFNGPILGKKEEAVEFARWVDQGLVELRRNNESRAFDRGIT